MGHCIILYICFMLKATGITKSFGELRVLKGIDLEVIPGKIISITGSSGAGKSTLLHILGTLDKPDSGSVTYDGQNIFTLNDKAISSFRNKKIGFVFQFHHLLPEFTALENICMPALIAGTGKEEAVRKAQSIMQKLQLLERKDHKPSELSGGEQQRVAVARSLINDPAVIFADEPSGNLDSSSSLELHKLFLKLRDEMNQTFVIVTHNPELAEMSDQKLTMKDGLIIST